MMVRQGLMAGVCAMLVAGGPSGAEEPIRPLDMVVTPSRTALLLRNVPASVDVIEAETLALSGGPVTMASAFKSISGVDVQGGGVPGSRSKINMRGLAPGLQTKRLLLLVDGRRVNEQYQGIAEFMTQSLDNVERIEVLRGPASALYGSGAMSGVVNITSRRGQETPVTEFRVAGGDHNTLHLVARHGAMQGNLDYFFTGSHVQTDGYLRNADGHRQDWESGNLTGNLGYRLGDNSELRLYLGGYDAEGRDDQSDREVRKDYQMADYRTVLDTELEADLLVRGYRNGDKYIYDWFDRPAGVYRQESLGAEVQQSLWMTHHQKLTGGLEARRESVDVDEVQQTLDRSTTVSAAYLQDEFHWRERFVLTVGGRVDHSEDYATEISPRLGLLVKATEAAELYASYNRAHRAPALSDRFVRVEFRGMQFVGNPDLDPETLTAYEVGGRWRMTDRVRLRAAAFYNDLDDAFESMFDPQDGTFRNANVARAETYGFELSAEGQLENGLTGFANLAWTEGTTRRHPPQPSVEGNRLAYLAREKVNAGLTYEAGRAGMHRVTVGYTGSRYGDAQNTPENRMDAYTTISWASRIPVGDHFWLTLNIDNLTDEDYREYPQYPQPGRTVMAGVDMRF